MPRKIGVAIFAALVMAVCFVPSVFAGGSDIVVEPGDTVWGLVNRYGAGATQEKIDEFMALNGMESPDIYPGDVFQIPASWPMFVSIPDFVLETLFSEMYDIKGGMLNSLYPDRHFEVVSAYWKKFDNPSGYWPRFSEDSVALALPKHSSWTVYPLGLTYSPEQGFQYHQTVGYGESMLFHDGELVNLAVSDVLAYEEYRWEGDWDSFICSHYYEGNIHYAAQYLLRDAGDIFRIDIYSMSALSIESEPLPENFGADPLSDEFGADIFAVDWVVGEPLTVTAVEYVDRPFEWSGWNDVQDYTSLSSIWRATYPMDDHIVVRRSDGSEVVFTDFYDLAVNRDHGMWCGSDPVVGEVLWVEPYAQMSLPEESGGYGYLSVSEDNPSHELNFVELTALSRVANQGHLSMYVVGEISGTTTITGTHSDGSVWSNEYVAFSDGRHLNMNQYYAPQGGTCVLVPIWDTDYMESQGNLWREQVGILEVPMEMCRSDSNITDVLSYLNEAQVKVWYLNYDALGILPQYAPED